MIPYEELVEALDRYVARRGAPRDVSAVRASMAQAGSGRAQSGPSFAPPPVASEPHEVDLGQYDEQHDPDLPPLAAGEHEEESTHVGAMPGTPQRTSDHPSDEIDIGDVLSDDEL